MYMIYKVENLLDGKVYIGQTTDIARRLKEHAKYPDRPLSVEARRIGLENFRTKILCCAKTKEKANAAEAFWTYFYRSNEPAYGYNIQVATSISDQQKQKNGGKNHWTTRQSFTEETKRKMSAAQSGEKSNTARRCRCIDTGEVFECALYAEEKYNLPKGRIWAVCRGERKSTGGLHFEYID